MVCCLSQVQDEYNRAQELLHSRGYLRIGSDDYKKIWYQLSTSPDAVKWPNVLTVCELLFSLPFSTVKVERLFSTLKIIKNEKMDLGGAQCACCHILTRAGSSVRHVYVKLASRTLNATIS